MEKEDHWSDSGSSSSGLEDEDALELTGKVEKNFFKTLSCLKKKDPRIYDKETRFFHAKPELDEEYVKQVRKKKREEKPLDIRTYEKNILLQNEGKFEEEEEGGGGGAIDEDWNSTRDKPYTYVQEQNEVKASFKTALADNSDDSDEEFGGLFHQPSKSKTQNEAEEEQYKEWLKGQKPEIEDKSTEGDMKFLHDYWNDPNLDAGEKFVRDYILNKRYLEEDKVVDKSAGLDLKEDDETLAEQSQFEHKYNFRFEEPDREFIKRYPRVMESSMRKKDDRRKLKRKATRERKKAEKEEIKKNIKKQQSLKFKEIKEKIQKLKDLTGNPNLGFQDEDIEKDFDPDEHDLKMQELFNDDFYNEKETEKPVFEDDEFVDNYQLNSDGVMEPTCEDPDFIMDCDYNPEEAMLKKKKKLEARYKKKKKKSNLLDDPDESKILNIDDNIDEDMKRDLNEYYDLDCDFVGDTSCRFKYREVVPNSFGLTIDEILAADDEELDRWCPQQKTVQRRSKEVEVYEVSAYKNKARNEELKRKILPSLYKSDTATKAKKKKKKKNVLKNDDDELMLVNSKNSVHTKMTNKALVEANNVQNVNDSNSADVKDVQEIRNKKKLTKDIKNSSIAQNGISLDTDVNVKKAEHRKKKRKFTEGNTNKKKLTKDIKNSAIVQNGISLDTDVNVKQAEHRKKKRKFTEGNTNTNESNLCSPKNHKIQMRQTNNTNSWTDENFEKKNKLKNGNKSRNGLIVKQSNGQEKQNVYCDLSDKRLKAYGIKPKKFRNKLKYGPK